MQPIVRGRRQAHIITTSGKIIIELCISEKVKVYFPDGENGIELLAASSGSPPMERRRTEKGAWQTSPIPIVFFVDFEGGSAHPISVHSIR